IAKDWLKKQKGPWFLWMHIWDPHFPYQPPEPFLTQFKDRPYEGEVAYVDSVLGDFFNFMKQAGLYEKTLIVFTSDHGESLGEHGERTHGILAYNTTIWVPLIIYIPGKEHSKVQQLVSHTDIFPSVCDILGVETPPFLQGISVLPALKGKKLPERRIYFESLEPYYNYGWAPLRGYIENKEKYFDSPIPELYFLDKDFEENQNKASTKNMENYKKRLDQTLRGLTHPENSEARSKPDRETLEKLKSLGYVGSPVLLKKEKYGPEDDVKILLPVYNEIADAYTLREEGKIEEGIELLQQIIKKQKKVYFAYTYLAKLYRESNRMQDALDILKQGWDVHPLCYEIISLYSEYLLDAGRFDEVIDILNSQTLTRMEHDALLWNYLGLAYMKKRDTQNAVKAFETAVSVDQEYADVFVNLGRLYFSDYLRTKEKNAYNKSIHNYKKAIEVEPDNAEAFFALGVAYMQERRNKDAIYLFEITLILDPGLTKAYYYLGLAYLTNKNLNEAFSCLSAYKKIAYKSLSNEEKMTLDYLINRAKPESR
ncbi:MAG: sulfatase-like hydrolase/transferase, partial [Candidatus Aminicenantes bacterium]|nr:sulfatase-like hydrolase/transferase [Candidatus Aminicenantes bacterium]MDH5707288.1 sulfatase-like hydrolase/transferase [Candidatus Aminicenantes bacterium]